MRALPRWAAGMLERVAVRLAPQLAGAGEAERAAVLAVIDGALAERPERVRRQVGVLLGLIRWLPVVRWGVRFDRLSPARQDAMLRWFQDAPLGLARKGFWGLRTLVWMGWYGRPECWPEVGYEQDLEGNERLGARDRG